MSKCNCSDEEKTCNCNGECTCLEECNCTSDSKCSSECTCDNECNCNDECECTHDEKKDKHKKHDKISKLEDKIEELCLKLEQAQDNVIRSQAELVNYRKRKDEEVSKLYVYCNESIVKELLPTLDSFERAIKMDDDNLDDEVSKFLEGFKMIYCNMLNTLEKYGVKPIDGANKPFDPTYHQAVMTETRDDIEKGIVLEVLQKGYLLKDRVIRPAMVRVSE